MFLCETKGSYPFDPGSTTLFLGFVKKNEESLHGLMFLSILPVVAFLSEATRRGSFCALVSFGRWAPLLRMTHRSKLSLVQERGGRIRC